MINNQIKTALLLGLLTGLLLFLGYLIGGNTGIFVGLVLSILMNFGTYWFSDKIVLMMYKAKQVDKNHELYKLVEGIAKEARLPMPKVYIIPANNLNAFATGRSPKNAAVAATEGIIRNLTKEELKGVMAHELSHVKNRDTLIATIAATIAGVISYLAYMTRFAAMFGNRDNENSGNIFALLGLAILTPIIATIIQLAISRSREYIADESGARMIKNPEALARALEKLELHNKAHPMMFGSPATSSLFIVNPFRGQALLNLFSTHPQVQERVKRLRALKI